MSDNLLRTDDEAAAVDAALRIVNLQHVAELVEHQGVPVHGADALGVALHTNGHLGADMLWVPAGARFPVHVHPGDHLLLCLAGEGTITVNEVTYHVRPGDFYMVDGSVPHAVGAGGTDHVLVAIGAPHKPVDSPERMTFTDWQGNKVDKPLFHGSVPELTGQPPVGWLSNARLAQGSVADGAIVHSAGLVRLSEEDDCL